MGAPAIYHGLPRRRFYIDLFGLGFYFFSINVEGTNICRYLFIQVMFEPGTTRHKI